MTGHKKVRQERIRAMAPDRINRRSHDTYRESMRPNQDATTSEPGREAHHEHRAGEVAGGDRARHRRWPGGHIARRVDPRHARPVLRIDGQPGTDVGTPDQSSYLPRPCCAPTSAADPSPNALPSDRIPLTSPRAEGRGITGSQPPPRPLLVEGEATAS